MASGTHVELISRMREGMIYVDGAHLRVPFHQGSRLLVGHSSHPLRMISACE